MVLGFQGHWHADDEVMLHSGNRRNSVLTKRFIINIQTRQLLWVLFLLEAARFLWLLQLSPLSVKLFKLFPPVILTSGSCQ